MSSDSRSVVCFAVLAEPDPGALPRVLEVFAASGLVPSRFMSDLESPRGERLAIEVQLAGVEVGEAARIARRLTRLVPVSEVLWSLKHRLEVA